MFKDLNEYVEVEFGECFLGFDGDQVVIINKEFFKLVDEVFVLVEICENYDYSQNELDIVELFDFIGEVEVDKGFNEDNFFFDVVFLEKEVDGQDVRIIL